MKTNMMLYIEMKYLYQKKISDYKFEERYKK